MTTDYTLNPSSKTNLNSLDRERAFGPFLSIPLNYAVWHTHTTTAAPYRWLLMPVRLRVCMCVFRMKRASVRPAGWCKKLMESLACRCRRRPRSERERDDAPATFAVTNYQFSHPCGDLFSVRRFFSPCLFCARAWRRGFCVEKWWRAG